MGERMRDLGKAAMMAAAMNTGLASEAEAGYKPEVTESKVEHLSATHIYEVSDNQTKKIFDQIDDGDLRVVPSRTVPSVFFGYTEKVVNGIRIGGSSPMSAWDESDPTTFSNSISYVKDIWNVAGNQGLKIDIDGGKITSTRGEGIEWNFSLLNKNAETLADTKHVSIQVEGQWLVVEVINTDDTVDKITFVDGQVISAEKRQEKNK